jgi:RNA polymerase sigma-70 factor (ECF subfamily)
MRSEKETIHYELLIFRCNRNDNEAWSELIRLWEHPLYYYIRRIVDTEQDAKDSLQMTWMKVFRNLRTLRDVRAFPAWIYRLARNAAYSHIRKEKTGFQVIENDVDDQTGPDLSNFCSVENALTVHQCLQRIPIIYREVLSLFFLDDLSLSEMSEVLDIPLGTVKSRLFKAKQILGNELREGAKHE